MFQFGFKFDKTKKSNWIILKNKSLKNLGLLYKNLLKKYS